MSDVQTAPGRRNIRHRDRVSQTPIYLGKLLRSFVFMNDWKVLPMSAVVAALVSMVVGSTMFISMEGNMMGAFALTCVAIWNGCFNSIQSVCRERPIIKREHRSGMYITSYVFAHMIYQALLCIAQTVITLYVCRIVGMKFPTGGIITGKFTVDLFITVFLITYAADMLSLFVSSVVHSTTAAMTVMPFILIFQLVFSGSALFSLPEWATPIKNMTISSYGIKAICSQSDYNSKPLVASWNALFKMRNTKIDREISVGDVVDFFSDTNNVKVNELRAKTISQLNFVASEDVDDDISSLFKLNPEELRSLLSPTAVAIEEFLGDRLTLGELLDAVKADPDYDMIAKNYYHVNFTVNDLIQLVGEETVRNTVMTKSAEANYNPSFEYDPAVVLGNWLHLLVFIILMPFLSMVALKFVDKDKR